MKRTIASITLALSFLSLFALGIVFYSSRGSIPTAQAKNDFKPCTLSSLKGTYGYTLTGFYSPSPGFNVPIGVVGTSTLGEDGSLTNIQTTVINGQVTETTYSGTFTLNPDRPCTGKTTFDNGLKDDVVIVNDGAELQVIQTAPLAPSTTLQVVITGTAKKQ